MMTSRRSMGGGAELCGSVGLLVLAKQGRLRLVVALLLVVISTIADHGHCITPAPAPAPGVSSDPTQRNGNSYSFDWDEADALIAVFKNWSALNPQLSTVLNWTSVPPTHPCNISGYFDSYSSDGSPLIFDGAWVGVGCAVFKSDGNSTAEDYDVLVTSLTLIGSNLRCVEGWRERCYNFSGIDGVLPSNISGLVNLTSLSIRHNPKLTGPIPPEIWQMPNLQSLVLDNNSLVDTLPSHVPNASSTLTWIDLSHNNLTGGLQVRPDGTLFGLPDLERLYLGNNQLDGPLDFQKLGANSLLSDVNISFNNFNGSFSWGPDLNLRSMDFSNNRFKNFTFETYNGTKDIMSRLQELYMGNNSLSGKFTSEILKVPSLQALYGDHNQYERLELPDNVPIENATLNNIILTCNKFKDVIFAKSGLFEEYILQVSNILFLYGNPTCKHIESEVFANICRSNRTSPRLIVVPNPSFKKRIIIGTCTSGAIIFMMVSLYVWKLMHRIASLRNILAEFEKKEVKPNLYSYREIKLATMNFHKRNKLGEGGFGVVYKGELSDGTTVAVKKLTLSSSQGLSEFLNEVVVISGLKHRNLVKLKGCCLGDGDQRMLVFEYVENKNLGEALWVEGISRPSHLNWNTRFNIIIGTARGLAYLHEELQPPVIHRDIKAANILLDKNYNPKIADFGLAFLFPVLSAEDTHLTLVEIAGTRGYCSPEYVLHGHISTALDVYSFGIMTLEVVSGRRNINLQKSSGEVYLRDWAWTQFEAHSLTMLIDSNMEHSSLDLEAITRVINVALACVQYKATKRPKMHDVVSMLLGNMPISKFSKDNEYEASGGASSSFTTRSNTISFGENINPDVDECSLLHNAHEIEMSVRR